MIEPINFVESWKGQLQIPQVLKHGFGKKADPVFLHELSFRDLEVESLSRIFSKKKPHSRGKSGRWTKRGRSENMVSTYTSKEGSYWLSHDFKVQICIWMNNENMYVSSVQILGKEELI